MAAPRPDYQDRRVEITGPTDRKLVINALNSGARDFMADFEDANSPTWQNQIGGHVNLIDAIEGTIAYDSSDSQTVFKFGVASIAEPPRQEVEVSAPPQLAACSMCAASPVLPRHTPVD